VVRLLLACEGLSINQALTNGSFPLYVACQQNHVEVVRLLLAAQAQVNQVKRGGWSACHIAAQNGHVQALEMLLEAGADVQLKSDDGRTALDLAIHFKQPAAEAVIRKHLAKAKLEANATESK
jgi:ankyrin repeat protein